MQTLIKLMVGLLVLFAVVTFIPKEQAISYKVTVFTQKEDATIVESYFYTESLTLKPEVKEKDGCIVYYDDLDNEQPTGICHAGKLLRIEITKADLTE